ncbi:MAG: hypothetical protein EP336_07600 [Rhodobacteraceae bacterium]|nr:MAG: hypothetical protein EP336_07600 [Paracoccaceae bacterium]
MSENILQLATFGIACVGAVLGILNTWRNFRSDKVRLKVRPEHVIVPNDSRDFLGIRVANIGSPTITIVDVGIELGGKKFATVATALQNGFTEGELPKKLATREVAQFIVPNNALASLQSEKPLRVYVRTACGERFRGNSGAFNQISRWLREGKYS